MTTTLEDLAARWEADGTDRAGDGSITRAMNAQRRQCAAELRATEGWRDMESDPPPPDDRDILWCEGPGGRVSVVNREHYGECFLHGLWRECPEPPR
jgi:hypothetical protein